MWKRPKFVTLTYHRFQIERLLEISGSRFFQYQWIYIPINKYEDFELNVDGRKSISKAELCNLLCTIFEIPTI